MIKETELNLFVPAPELLVRLASGDRPLGISAAPPRIRLFRETFFDTPDEVLRRRGMTCKLRQGEGEVPSVVVTVGEGPDSEGITSRSRLTASSVGAGIFETLRGDSEVATQIQKFVDPGDLRPVIALDIQRLGRVHRRGFFRLPVLYLFFDRITVQAGGVTSLLHELRIRRRRPGGPLIRDLGQQLRDQHHLFPDGQSTLQRAYRVLSLDRKGPDSPLSPYTMSLALILFRDGKMALSQRGDLLCVPSFRGSGEDAARALAADLTGSEDIELDRLGATEPREGRSAVEVWVTPNPPAKGKGDRTAQGLIWYPWHSLLEMVGQGGIRDPNLISALTLLTRRRLLGELPWIPPHTEFGTLPGEDAPTGFLKAGQEGTAPELGAVEALLPHLRMAERKGASLPDRLKAVAEFTLGIDQIFLSQIKELKGKVLGSAPDTEATDETDPALLLDFLAIRIRGLVDRLYHVVNEDLLPALEDRHIYIQRWIGLMPEERRKILEDFSSRFLSGLQVVADWGPAFVPEMPPSGCALGLTARVKGSEATRFFHVILSDDTPPFLPVPGSSVVLPLEEVIRGYLFSQHPELEEAETYIFRFRTAEVTVREAIRTPIVTPPPGTPTSPTAETDSSSPDSSSADVSSADSPPADPSTAGGPQLHEVLIQETVKSVVTRVMAHQRMPESHQAQLLRALERQVTRNSPLIGWSDIYTVDGPMDLTGLVDLLELDGRIWAALSQSGTINRPPRERR